MTIPKDALEKIRDHSVGTTEDGQCIECEHMIDIAKAAIPVAAIHANAMKLVLAFIDQEVSLEDVTRLVRELRGQLKALK